MHTVALDEKTVTVRKTPIEFMQTYYTQVSLNAPSFVYQGFNYFSNVDLVESSSDFGNQFIVAYSDEGILGVLKYKRYEKKTNKYVPEAERTTKNTYLAVRFIDVRKDKRHKGLAKELILVLNSEFDQLETLVLSPLTSLGVKAKLKKLFTHICFNAKVKSYNEYFR